MTGFLAGIVLYNPLIDRLEENIAAIADQVDKIIFIDNSMNQTISVLKCINKCLEKNNYVYINNNANLGIAKALNQIMQYAFDHQYKWVLTLDQDTVCPCQIIEKFEPYTYSDVRGIICPKIRDRNFEFINNEHGETNIIDNCITSAALTSTSLWKKIGGFSEELFIDYVDFDYCLNLKTHGYHILRVNSVEILHEIGHAKTVNMCGKRMLLFNHPPIRNYYIVRNKLYCAYKYKNIIDVKKEKKEIFTHIVRVLLFEGNKARNMVCFYKGIKDGKKMIIGMKNRK